MASSGFAADGLVSANQEVLHGRFVEGSGIHGANLKLACIDMSWDKQQQQFAKFLLVDLFAIYEGWLEHTLTDVGMNTKSLLNSLQAPSDPLKPSLGVGAGLVRLQTASSPMLKGAFYDPLILHSKNSHSRLEQLFIAYRCFKELRNSLMHRGGKADDRVVAAYVAYSALTASDLKSKELPQVHVPILGENIALSLRGVVGFADVIRRLIATLDAELACVNGATAELNAQLNLHFATPGRTKKTRYALPADALGREKKVRKLIGKIGLPRPRQIALLELHLKSHRLID
jgi:hypothetical protein